MYYKGPVVVSAGIKKVLSAASDAATTDYGDSFVWFEFEVGEILRSDRHRLTKVT